ncbi:hypothetical protein GSU2300 [Geobacter sulfurreducens PCA]|jgi:hypothetical protein|uniref:Uncharacterized protein n=1 Tax=Geobacter sulfurreducens (strain ATCC 51573 / DSM 12127 / PCA) TaxID=243231 RepID=Q74AQ2_GEOSL|nr:hypothetical protein GSU2300 [Geobacter sulfurreducens PCA]HCD95061.1 hypothetical protein [Geobacter sulfurreducens]
MAALFHFRTSSTNPLPTRKAATTGITLPKHHYQRPFQC